jgi:hypothetical protein
MCTVIVAIAGVMLFCVFPLAVIYAPQGAWIGGMGGTVIGVAIGLCCQGALGAWIGGMVGAVIGAAIGLCCHGAMAD